MFIIVTNSVVPSTGNSVGPPNLVGSPGRLITLSKIELLNSTSNGPSVVDTSLSIICRLTAVVTPVVKLPLKSVSFTIGLAVLKFVVPISAELLSAPVPPVVAETIFPFTTNCIIRSVKPITTGSPFG